MHLRKLNLHFTFTEVPHEISKSERRLHCRNLFLEANEKGCIVELSQISHFQ